VVASSSAPLFALLKLSKASRTTKASSTANAVPRKAKDPGAALDLDEEVIDAGAAPHQVHEPDRRRRADRDD